MTCDPEFIKRMHEEKLASQKRRADYNVKKFLFVGSLFTVGVAKLPEGIDLNLVLYIVPAVSVCFDLFILGEDYGIKRIGGFIRIKCTDTIDSMWEDWVGTKKRRDPFATLAIPFLTLIVLVACAAIIFQKQGPCCWFWVWVVANVVATIFLFIYSQYLRRKLLDDSPKKRMLFFD
jgi:hypothetical protein